jgi:lipoprotein NlpD
MNKGTFAKRLVLPVLVGVLILSAGCSHPPENVTVRDSRPVPTTARTLPVTPDVPPPAIAQPGEHVVRQGETLYAVSRLYNVPVRDLIAWNNLSRPEQLEVGQTLRVAPGAVAEPLAPVPMPHDVAKLPEVKREPRGGKEAWSEETWARLHPQVHPQVQPQPDPQVHPQPQPAPAATISRPELSTPGSGSSIDWMWPVKGTIIIRFDEPMDRDGKVRNRGLDIAGTPGTPILAAAGGKVVYAGSGLRGLGKMVIVKHNDEYLTAYAHNRDILVAEGDTVARGQKIAELGSTDADRPKLHFEVRKHGTPVDPLKYLPGL